MVAPATGREVVTFFQRPYARGPYQKQLRGRRLAHVGKLRRRRDVKRQVYWNPRPAQASIEHVVLSLTTVSIPGGAFMPKLTSPLDHIKIAAPCPADWDQMFSFEDERVRFCSQCNLNVYNLSGMSRQEAEALITKTEGRLCVRFYRRADGSVLTQNCPVGLKAIKRRVAWVAQVVLGIVSSLVSGLGLYIFVQPSVHMGRVVPVLDPAPPPERGRVRIVPRQ